MTGGSSTSLQAVVGDWYTGPAVRSRPAGYAPEPGSARNPAHPRDTHSVTTTGPIYKISYDNLTMILR